MSNKKFFVVFIYYHTDRIWSPAHLICQCSPENRFSSLDLHTSLVFTFNMSVLANDWNVYHHISHPRRYGCYSSAIISLVQRNRKVN